jgi:hypothetical protein
MTDSRHFSTATKRAAFARSHGRCENPACRSPFPAGGGGVEYDHVNNWHLSRDSSLDNCAALCGPCHLKKTGGYDIPVIAKMERLADARMGIKRVSKPLPAGRNSGIRKKLNGQVVRRPERGEEHRRLMTKRYGEQP